MRQSDRLIDWFLTPTLAVFQLDIRFSVLSQSVNSDTLFAWTFICAQCSDNWEKQPTHSSHPDYNIFLYCEATFNSLAPIFVGSTKCIDLWVLEFVVLNITCNNQWENCIWLDFYSCGLSVPRNPQELETHD